ncbi:predicted protein [Plenodomus lingam JN3]|uniref:Predicted protein n=1 Tax=Leptosphaeria maculans (strain JN3 / isolate v23.1.3 / race Av1-4-5-6-7-8) TaxID=985895 RepID=E4ZQ60_LEPMJ|nr:predicted protein [Plenodomus lingam JN3]CBX89970.1 predicted protein [Plenodomus lingam JN3]
MSRTGPSVFGDTTERRIQIAHVKRRGHSTKRARTDLRWVGGKADLLYNLMQARLSNNKSNPKTVCALTSGPRLGVKKRYELEASGSMVQTSQDREERNKMGAKTGHCG